jgi:hypothetical protein
MQMAQDFSALATISPNLSSLNLSGLFEASNQLPSGAPIDQFLRNADQLNLMYLNQDGRTSGTPVIDPLLARLILLGYVSAFESFVRAVVRGLINIDEVCKKTAESHLVSFGAALHHSKDLLPEALMEGTSLADRDNLKKTFEKFLNVQIEEDLKGPLVDQFRIVCHLRHCCVHRFGRLGSQNALGMGLIDSPNLLEKNIMLDVTSLTCTAEVLRTFAKVLNNALFKRVLVRTAEFDHLKWPSLIV